MHKPNNEVWWWILGAMAVVAWRTAAYFSAGRSLEPPLSWGLTLLGLLFVAGGLFARWWLHTPGTSIFGLYALSSGLHWGGPIGSTNLDDNPYWLGIYLVLSSVLSQAFLLHFTLEFPSPIARSKVALRPLLYAPTVASAGVVIGLWSVPEGARQALVSLLLLLYGVANFYSLAAFVILVVRSFRSGPAIERHAARLVLSVFLLGALPYLLTTVGTPLPGDPEGYNLFFGLVPIGLVVGVSYLERVSRPPLGPFRGQHPSVAPG